MKILGQSKEITTVKEGLAIARTVIDSMVGDMPPFKEYEYEYTFAESSKTIALISDSYAPPLYIQRYEQRARETIHNIVTHALRIYPVGGELVSEPIYYSLLYPPMPLGTYQPPEDYEFIVSHTGLPPFIAPEVTADIDRLHALTGRNQKAFEYLGVLSLYHSTMAEFHTVPS